MVRKVDGRSKYKYVVIIKNGTDWRLFSDIDLMCELMGLDKVVLGKYFELRGYYTGYNFTVFRVVEETFTRHRGMYNG